PVAKRGRGQVDGAAVVRRRARGAAHRGARAGGRETECGARGRARGGVAGVVGGGRGERGGREVARHPFRLPYDEREAEEVVRRPPLHGEVGAVDVGALVVAGRV